MDQFFGTYILLHDYNDNITERFRKLTLLAQADPNLKDKLIMEEDRFISICEKITMMDERFVNSTQNNLNSSYLRL